MSSAADNGSPRRQLVAGLGAASVALLPVAPAMAEIFKDPDNGYEVRYPLGYQKYKYPGFKWYVKDLVEPLESIGVQVADTTRKSLDEIGDAQQVGKALMADQVPKKAPQEIINAETKYDKKGRRFDIIEYAFQWKYTDKEIIKQIGKTRYQLHNKALITIDNNKQYVVLVNADESRWKKAQDKLEMAINSFKLTFT